MSKAYAKTRAEEKKKNSSASSQQSSYEKSVQIYNQQKELDIQAAKRASENFTRASTYNQYNSNLRAYMDRLNALRGYGYNTSTPMTQVQQEVKRIQPDLQQENRYMQALQEQRELERRKREARNSQPWAVRVGLVNPNEAEMTFGVYDPSASERGRLSNVLAAGGKGWLAGQQNALGFALDPSQPDEAEMFFGKAPTSKLGEKISSKINEALFNQSQRLYGASDELNRQALEHETAAKKGLGKFGQTLVDTGMAGTQMLLDASIGRATGTGMASMGTRTFGQSAREALDSGATYQQAMDYGALSAAVELGTEKMFDVAKIFGGGGLDKAIEKWIVKYAKTPAGMTILRTIASASGEGLEEIISSAVNPLLRSGYDPDALKDYGTSEYWADMLHEGLVGALLGGIGVAGNVITGGNARMVNEVNQEALNARLQRADAFNEAQRKLFAGNTMQTGTADAEAARILNRNSGTQGARDKASVRAAAQEQYGVQAKAVESVFEAGTADAETFQRQFQTAYDLGKSGAAMETAMNTPATAELNELQRENAWAIGREAGIREGTIKEEANENGETVRVRGSGERNPVQGAAGEVQQVEGNAGSYQEGRSLSIGRSAKDGAAADLRYSEEVKSARDLGIENGAVIKNLRTVDESSYTPDMKQYAQEMAETGHKVTYVSGLIHAQDGPGGMITRARGMVNSNGDVIIQADNERFTALQIGRHEDGHLRIARGEIDLAATKETVRESMGQERFDRAMQDYAEAYAGLDMTPDEIWEEIVCDAQGEMNIFEGTLMQNAEQRASDLIRETKAQTTAGETTQQRAPPEGEQKMSAELDDRYMQAVESGDMEAAQAAVDEAAKKAGYTIHAYHGTGRADRVGNVFLPERSTSGPMAFFTDNRDIAANYARDKRDTSLAYDTDYDSYETQFRAKHTKTGKDYAIYKMWGYIPMSERAKIAEKAKHVRIDYDGDGDIIYDPKATEANGGWSWQVKEFRGDIFKALNEQWLNSGNLFNEEENYLKVLELVGANDALRKAGFEMPRYMNPDYREEAVYNTYLKIQNPFDATSMIDEDFIRGFEEFADENEHLYARESADADYWDKNSVSAEQFVERMRSDLESGVTHAWTSIPDVMSAYLKEQGYDGIKDSGGKNGGVGHTVWIPFTGEQVKSAEPVVRDDDGEIIPPSERFNPERNDIRFSRELGDQYLQAAQSGDVETAQRMVDEAAKAAGYDTKAYHGTPYRFNEFLKSKIGKTTDYGWFGRGFYFTTDKSVADVYAGYLNDSNVIEAYLSVHNPFVFSDYPGADEKSAGDIMNEVLGIRKKNSEMTEDEKAERSADFSDWLVENGYDGAKIWSQIMILDSEQAKRANVITYDDDGNIIPLSERFNPEKTDIRYSRETDIDRLARENSKLRREAAELQDEVKEWKAEARTARSEANKNAKDAAKWKRETTVSKRIELREGDVQKAAQALLQSMQSEADISDLAGDLKALGEYILNGDEDGAMRWGIAEEMATDAAAKIVKNAVEVDERDPEYLSYLLTHTKGKPVHVDKKLGADIAYEMGCENITEFNKKYGRWMRLTYKDSAADIEQIYQQTIDGDALTQDQMVREIIDTISALQPQITQAFQQYDADYDAAVSSVALQVLDAVMDESIRQMPPTFADKALAKREAAVQKAVEQERAKADKRVEKAQASGEAKLQKQASRFEERLRRVKEQGERDVERAKYEYAFRANAAMRKLIERHEKQVENLKARYEESRRNERERREEREGINKYRKRVEQKAKQLGDWLLKNSAKEHIPENLKKPVAEFLATIDFTSKRQLRGGAETQKDKRFAERLRALTSTLEKMQSGGAEDSLDSIRQHEGLPPYYMEFLKMLSDKAVTAMENGDVYTINQMTAAELKTLDETITAVVKTIRMMNRLYENGRAANAQALGFETIEEMDKLGAKKASGERGDAVRSFFAWDNTNPFYAFKRLGSAAQSVFEEIQNGWDRFAFNVIRIMDFAKEAYTSEEVRKWGNEVHEFELESGEKVYMTTAQIMSLRMLLRREQAVQHIQGGGVRIDDIDAKGKGNKHLQAEHYHLTAKDIETITGTLTERQREVANKLQKFMQKQGGEWGNHVSRARWDIDFFGEENYFPIVTEDSDRNAIDPEARANDLFRLLNMGATKSLNPNANNALVIRDIFDVFADHMTDMAKYDGLALPILDAMKWLNYRYREETSYDEETGRSEYRSHTVQRAIEKAYGKEALRYLTTFMRDLNGVNESTGRGEGFARKMISNYKVAAVAANLRVALLQPTSYFRALYAINGRYLARALFAKPAVKECEKYSGMAAWKSLGYYDTNIARGVREQIKDSGGVKDKVQEASMKGAEWGDKLTWGALWNACKFAVKNEKPGLDHEALMEATAKKFREVVYSTQVVDSTMTRSHNMRGKSIYGSMATAFMAEPTLSYNIVMDAVSEYQNEARRTNRQEAWKKTRGKVAKAFTVYCLSALAASIAESLMDAFRDDDEYEKFYQKFLEAMFGEKGLKGRLNGNLVNDLLIFNKIPLIKDALSLLSGYSTDRIDMEWMSNAIKAFGAIKEKIELGTGKLEQPTKTTYYGNMTWYGAVYLGLKTLSQATGLPVGSATREVVTLWNNTVGGMTGQKIVTYDSKPEKQIQKGFENGWLTEENAIRLLVDEGAAKDEDDAWFKVQKWSTGEGKFDAAADAMIAGDKKAFNAAVKNLTAHGVKQKSVESSMKSTINKLYVGTDEEPASISAEKAKKLLQDYVGMKADEAADLMRKWSAKIETGVAYGDRNDAYQDGDLTDQQYLNMVTKYGGKTQEDAQELLNEQKCLKQYGVEYGVKPVQQAIIDGDITKEQATKIWKDFGEKSDEDIEELIAASDFVKAHPDVDLENVTSMRVDIYNQYAPKGTDAAKFMEYAAQIRKDQNAGKYPGIPDGKGGKKPYSVMDDVARWINSLPITSGEKTALLLTYTNGKTTSLSRYTWS